MLLARRGAIGLAMMREGIEMVFVRRVRGSLLLFCCSGRCVRCRIRGLLGISIFHDVVSIGIYMLVEVRRMIVSRTAYDDRRWWMTKRPTFWGVV